jgi:pSer/pThr/pTyr-binding forkhead associated (FHA) protein
MTPPHPELDLEGCDEMPEEPMYCAQCGAELPAEARFCPSCGAAVEPGREVDVDQTTAAIDVGALDPTSSVEGLPALEPGTAMLVVIRGPNAGARYLLDRDTTTVGRHPDCEIFLHDVTVSRRHSEFRRSGDGFELRDLGSLNGTYVNGQRVEAEALKSGDEVQIGRFKLLYVDSTSEGGQT